MMNIFDQNSSNSQDSNADDFGGLVRKVDGQFHDSDQSSSFQINEKFKRKNYSKRISSLLKDQNKQVDKTKAIKKNCISAKQSRQRKKLYIEVLEQKAQMLKKEINKRRQTISANRDAILDILRQNNPEKSKFIEQNLEDSQNLVKQISKTQDSRQGEKQAIQKEKEKKLQLMINSYLYKFGFTGVLRKDVIEQLKARWYEIVIDQNLIMMGKQAEIRKLLEEFKQTMRNIEQKSSQAEFLVRKLQDKLSKQQIIRFLIDQRFFVAKQEAKPPINISEMKCQSMQSN